MIFSQNTLTGRKNTGILRNSAGICNLETSIEDEEDIPHEDNKPGKELIAVTHYVMVHYAEKEGTKKRERSIINHRWGNMD
jgi:hypothetical protein